jgi:IBR domain, a half RING-finger domain/Ariadne domain
MTVHQDSDDGSRNLCKTGKGSSEPVLDNGFSSGEKDANAIPDSVMQDDSDSTVSMAEVHNDEDSYCYESDYEYHEEDDVGCLGDDDDDDDDFSNQENRKAESFKKPKIIEDDSHDDSCHFFDAVQDPSDIPLVASLPRRVSVNSSNHTRMSDSNSFCGLCQSQEVHTPVIDCSLVQDWNRLVSDCGNGILDVQAHLLIYAMRARVEECYTYLHTTLREADGWPRSPENANLPPIDDDFRRNVQQEEASAPTRRGPRRVPRLDLREQQRDQAGRRHAGPRHIRHETSERADRFFAHKTRESVAADLRAHRWDLQAWRQAMRRRRELETEWLGVNAPWQTNEIRRAEQLRIEREIADLGLDSMILLTQEHEDNANGLTTANHAAVPTNTRVTFEQSRQRILEDHRNFLDGTIRDSANGASSAQSSGDANTRSGGGLVGMLSSLITGTSTAAAFSPPASLQEPFPPRAPFPPQAPFSPLSDPPMVDRTRNAHLRLEGPPPAAPLQMTFPPHAPFPPQAPFSPLAHCPMVDRTRNAHVRAERPPPPAPLQMPFPPHAHSPAQAPNPVVDSTQNDARSEPVQPVTFHSGAALNEEESFTCPICLDDEVEPQDRICVRFPHPYRGLERIEFDFCGHFYCRDCWANYIQAWLEDMRGAGGGSLIAGLFCPHPQCLARVTRDHVERVASGLQSPESSDPYFLHPMLRLYDELALNSFVEGHRRTICWCPGPNCSQIMVHCGSDVFVPSPGRQPVGVGFGYFTSCSSCDSRFCFHCGNSEGDHELREGALHCPRVIPFDDDEDVLVVGRRRGVFGEVGMNAAPLAINNPLPAVAGRIANFVLGRPHTPNDNEDVNTNKIRLCPRCKIPIEKNGGCAHMQCKCGHHFCWLCMADMNNNIGHFCGREGAGDIFLNNRRARYVGDQNPLVFNLVRMDMDFLVDQLRRYVQGKEGIAPDIRISYNDLMARQRELCRFAHYYNRYVFHNQGQEFADNQCECVANRASNYSHFSKIKSAADTDFFYTANERLVKSRRILKYSYPLLYFKLKQTVPSHDGHSSEIEVTEGAGCPADNALSASLPVSLALFMDHQERLERMTEQLSFLSENATTPSDRRRVMDMVSTF